MKKYKPNMNKIYGLILIILGVLSTLIDGDITGSVFLCIVGVATYMTKSGTERVIDRRIKQFKKQIGREGRKKLKQYIKEVEQEILYGGNNSNEEPVGILNDH